MSFLRPVGEWPLVICGPILRRITPNSVAVFVALSRPCKIVLEIYNDPNPGSHDTPRQSRSHDSIPLGENLHIGLVEWHGPPELHSNTVHGYDLRFEELRNPGAFSWLEDEKLLDSPYKLGYNQKLPSFTLPPFLKDLRIVHGSCRKPHAPGPDALAIVDGLIQNDHLSPLSRPHQLLLTGDQIYADDVSVSLLVMLKEAAKVLLNWANDEKVPLTGSDGVTPQNEEITPGLRRRSFINNETTFTSGISHESVVDGHLIFLGEFYAMYLAIWSDTFWPRAAEGTDNPYTLPTSQDLSVKPDKIALPLDNNEKAHYLGRLDAQREQVLAFAKTLPRIRRVLANVPTYMMFDDHEVTDDWNLHRKWSIDARNNLPGQQIIRNALLAYAVFQDWGNHPKNYTINTLGEELLKNITYNQTSRLVPIESQPRGVDRLLDIHATPTPFGQRMRWDWDYALTNRDYQIVALDTRTWRAFPASARGTAALIGSDPAKSDAQLLDNNLPLGFQLIARKPTDSRLTIVISPAPVSGHPIVELAQKAMFHQAELSIPILQRSLEESGAELERLLMLDPDSSLVQRERRKVATIKAKIASAKRKAETAREDVDNEAWSGNRTSYEDLLKRLAGFKRIIILSGDVHYAFSNQIAYFRTGPSTPEPARIVQFCSSSLKNEENLNRRLADLNYDFVPATLGWLGFNRDLTELKVSIKGALDTGILSTSETDPALARSLASIVFQFEMNERFSKPAVIPNGRYTDNRVFELVRDTARDPDTQQDLTDWRYTITYLRDERLQAEREADVANLGTLISKSPNFIHHNRMVIGSARAVVGTNNVGQLRFTSQSGSVINLVTHQLHWQVPLTSKNQEGKYEQTTVVFFTEHNASLDLPSVATEFPEVMP